MRKFFDGIKISSSIAAAGITFSILLIILGYIVFRGFSSISLGFISSLAPMFVTTLLMVAIAISIATPIGVCAAIFLVEYAKPGRTVNYIRFCIESLAGIPSIIYGLFGMIFFGRILHLGFSIMSGSLTVSIMVLPTIIRSTEEALRAVPLMYREASLALGATKLRTIIKVILPSAIAGVITSIILSIGRIVGETAAIYLTAGTNADMPTGAFSSGRTLAIHFFLLVKEGKVRSKEFGNALQQAFGAAIILIVIVILINISANALSRKLGERSHV